MKFGNPTVLFLIVFLDMLGFSIIFPIFPKILNFYLQNGDPLAAEFLKAFSSFSSKETGNTVLLGGILGSIYAVLQFIFAPVWGSLSDRYGRKPLMVWTGFGNLFGYLIWLFSGSFSLFILSRTVTGAMGGSISVASAAMADATNEKDRTKGMGMIGAGIGLGFVFGPPFGGISSEWNFSFLNNSSNPAAVPAFLSVLIALLCLSSCILFFKETAPFGSQEVRRHPIFSFSAVRGKDIAQVIAVYFIYTFGFSGFEFCLNFYLNDSFQFTPKQIGMSFVMMGGIIVLVQGGIIRRISGKIPVKKICTAGLFLLGFGFLLLSAVSDIYSVYAGLCFLSAGSAFLNPGLSSMASLFSGADEQGKNLGIMRGFGSLARACAPGTYSLVYWSLGGRSIFAVSFIMVFIGWLFLLKTREPDRKNA